MSCCTICSKSFNDQFVLYANATFCMLTLLADGKGIGKGLAPYLMATDFKNSHSI